MLLCNMSKYVHIGCLCQIMSCFWSSIFIHHSHFSRRFLVKQRAFKINENKILLVLHFHHQHLHNRKIKRIYTSIKNSKKGVSFTMSTTSSMLDYQITLSKTDIHWATMTSGTLTFLRHTSRA